MATRISKKVAEESGPKLFFLATGAITKNVARRLQRRLENVSSPEKIMVVGSDPDDGNGVIRRMGLPQSAGNIGHSDLGKLEKVENGIVDMINSHGHTCELMIYTIPEPALNVVEKTIIEKGTRHYVNLAYGRPNDRPYQYS